MFPWADAQQPVKHRFACEFRNRGRCPPATSQQSLHDRPGQSTPAKRCRSQLGKPTATPSMSPLCLRSCTTLRQQPYTDKGTAHLNLIPKLPTSTLTAQQWQTASLVGEPTPSFQRQALGLVKKAALHSRPNGQLKIACRSAKEATCLCHGFAHCKECPNTTADKNVTRPQPPKPQQHMFIT